MLLLLLLLPLGVGPALLLVIVFGDCKSSEKEAIARGQEKRKKRVLKDGKVNEARCKYV